MRKAPGSREVRKAPSGPLLRTIINRRLTAFEQAVAANNVPDERKLEGWLRARAS